MQHSLTKHRHAGQIVSFTIILTEPEIPKPSVKVFETKPPSIDEDDDSVHLIEHSHEKIDVPEPPSLPGINIVDQSFQTNGKLTKHNHVNINMNLSIIEMKLSITITRMGVPQ